MFWFNVILSVFPLVFFILFAYLAPESPYFYVGKNDFEAKRCLNTLRQVKLTYDVDDEIDEIKYEINKNQKGDFWNTIKQKYVVKGFIVALGLSSLQQLSGLAAILAYTQNIFDDAGSNFSPEISSIIIVGTVLFIASFGGPLIVDNRGRKFLLVCSSIGIITSESVLGLYFYIKERTTVSVEKVRQRNLLI
nr:unnamed protein product [Callosobruchus analis]